jgi:hypothetical protein
MRSHLRRGFVYYDIWLLLFGVGIVLVIIVPAAMRGYRQAKLRRAEYAAVVLIANEENDAYDTRHAYLDSSTSRLPDGVRLVSLRHDTSGFSVVVAVDSSRSRTPLCGMFQGSASLAPNGAVTMPSRIACW